MAHQIIKNFFIAIAAGLVIGATGCENKEQNLSGTYAMQTFTQRVCYEFDSTGEVELTVSTAGSELYSQQGTYQISPEENSISLNFQTESQNNFSGTFNYGGTFDFEQDENYIVIGGARYNKINSDADFSEQISDNKNTSVSEISLNLPENYLIKYEVTESSAGISRTYTQTMISSPEGIYLELGDSGDKYIFERQENGKYIQYQFNRITGKYETPMISAPLWEQIENGSVSLDSVTVGEEVLSGYTLRVTEYFDIYKNYSGNLEFNGNEKVGNFSCRKYTSEIPLPYGNQKTELWIEPETGLCVKEIYSYFSDYGVTGTKNAECVDFQPGYSELPDHK